MYVLWNLKSIKKVYQLNLKSYHILHKSTAPMADSSMSFELSSAPMDDSSISFQLSSAPKDDSCFCFDNKFFYHE